MMMQGGKGKAYFEPKQAGFGGKGVSEFVVSNRAPFAIKSVMGSTYEEFGPLDSVEVEGKVKGSS